MKFGLTVSPFHLLLDLRGGRYPPHHDRDLIFLLTNGISGKFEQLGVVDNSTPQALRKNLR